MVQFIIEYEQDQTGEYSWEPCRETYNDESKSLHKIVKRLQWLHDCMDVRYLKVDGELVDISKLPKVTSWKNAGEKIKKQLKN